MCHWGPRTVQITVIRLINLLIINVEFVLGGERGKWQMRKMWPPPLMYVRERVDEQGNLFCFVKQEITHVFVIFVTLFHCSIQVKKD